MVDDGGGDSAQGREIAKILGAFQQKDDRKDGGVTLDQRVPKSHLLGGWREVFGQFARMGDGLETRVGCSLDGSHRPGLLCTGCGEEGVRVYRNTGRRATRAREVERTGHVLKQGCSGWSPQVCARKAMRGKLWDEGMRAAMQLHLGPMAAFTRIFVLSQNH